MGVWLVEQGILSQATMMGGGTDCMSLIQLMPIVPEEETEDRAGMGIHLRIQNYITRRGGGQGQASTQWAWLQSPGAL